MRLEGKAAIISGGARGMGAAGARMFAKEGAKVVLGDVRDDLGKQVEAEINESGGEGIYVSLDVTDESSRKNAVDTAVSRFGKLYILLSNAGIVNDQSRDDATAEEWDRVMFVNAKGAVQPLTKAAAMQYANDGIRASSVHPGPIATQIPKPVEPTPSDIGTASVVPP